MGGIDSRYAWWRLAASVAISTLGGVGMWSIVVALPVVQSDLGVGARRDLLRLHHDHAGFLPRRNRHGPAGRHGTGIVPAIMLSALLLALGFAAARARAVSGMVCCGPRTADRLRGSRDLRTAGRRHLALVRGASRRRCRDRRLGNYIAGAIVAADRSSCSCVSMAGAPPTFGRRALPPHHGAAGLDAPSPPPPRPCELAGIGGGAALARVARPVAQRPAGPARHGRPHLLHRHVDAAGPYRRLLRRSRLRRGARRARCCR